MRHARLIAIVFVALLFAATARAAPSSRSDSSASLSSKAKLNSCCFCVYPNPGEKDSEEFSGMCQACLHVKYPGCEVRVAVARKDLKGAAEAGNCGQPIQIMNLEHGPDPSQVADIVEVCESVYPGCSVRVDDLSCSTYESDEAAQAAIQSLRSALPDGAVVNICGSGSVNMYAGCSFFRVTKRYVVAPGFTKETLGLCPAFGDGCDHSQDGGKVFKCIDTLGRERAMQCCPMREPQLGYWGDWPRCGGKGCTEKKCPTFQTCRDGAWKKQECTNDGVCVKFGFECAELNKVCGYGKTGEECVSNSSSSSGAKR